MPIASMMHLRNPRPLTQRRQRSIKTLLEGSSPKNPTYILAVVLADFLSQGSTELSVRKGDEIYVMYEINDWAYVACLTETSRRGYIPIDYCLQVEDFFYHNPSLSSQRSQNQNNTRDTSDMSIYRSKPRQMTELEKKSNIQYQQVVPKPTQDKEQSRRTLEPIEGSERSNCGFTVEKPCNTGYMYHSADNLMQNRIQYHSLTIHGSSQQRPRQGRALKRSNTVTFGSRPTNVLQRRPNPSRAEVRTVQRSTTTVRQNQTTDASRNSGATLVVNQGATLGTRSNTIYRHLTPISATQEHRTPNLFSQSQKSVLLHSSNNGNVKAKKIWGPQVQVKHRDSHTIELGEHAKRLSLSLETVDEISELDESFNSVGPPAAGTGIERLIAKFQSKIQTETKQMSASRLSSVGSIISSFSEDSDSVFTDGEDCSKTSIEPVATETTGSTYFTCEDTASTWKSEHQGVTTELQRTKTLQILHANSDSDKVTNNANEENNKIANGTLNTEVLHQLKYCSLSDDSLEETQCIVGEDFLLEPPSSFSTPGLSDSSTEVAADVADSTRSSSQGQISNSLNESSPLTLLELTVLTSDTASLNHRNMGSQPNSGTQSQTQAEANIPVNVDGKTAQDIKGTRDHSTQTINVSTIPQTTDSTQDLTITQTLSRTGRTSSNNRKPSATQPSNTFSRNARLRQSRVSTEAQYPESQYLLQPISPADVTDTREHSETAHSFDDTDCQLDDSNSSIEPGERISFL